MANGPRQAERGALNEWAAAAHTDGAAARAKNLKRVCAVKLTKVRPPGRRPAAMRHMAIHNRHGTRGQERRLALEHPVGREWHESLLRHERESARPRGRWRRLWANVGAVSRPARWRRWRRMRGHRRQGGREHVLGGEPCRQQDVGRLHVLVAEGVEPEEVLGPRFCDLESHLVPRALGDLGPLLLFWRAQWGRGRWRGWASRG